MQDHMGEFKGSFAGDFAILHHSCQGNGQRFAGGLRGLPANFFPVDFRSVGIEIGPEHRFFRIPLQQITNAVTQSSGGNQPGLLGKVGINIGFHQEVVDVFGEGTCASMEQHKVGFAQ
jgi:hypothetical protein